MVQVGGNTAVLEASTLQNFNQHKVPEHPHQEHRKPIKPELKPDDNN